MTAEEADKLDENILLDLTYDTLGKLSAEVSYTQDNEEAESHKSLLTNSPLFCRFPSV